MSAWLAALAIATSAWLLGGAFARWKLALPGPWGSALTGLLGVAGLLRWSERPFAEQALAWLLSVLFWAGLLVARDSRPAFAFGLACAAWGLLRGLARPPAAVSTPPAAAPHPITSSNSGAEPQGDVGANLTFRLELRCPTCGAGLAIPVYQRMARCDYCGSEHVVRRGSDTLAAVIPDTIVDQEALKAAVLKHFRHRHYLELYDRRVRPLMREQEFARDRDDPDLPLLAPDPNTPVLDALEGEVERAADAYAARLAPRLMVRSWQRFVSPYWHRFGTLYQAAFGRDAQGTKRMEFVVVTIEGSAPASTAPLPEMGKLSYLRALRPFLGALEAALPAVAIERGADEIDRKVQDLSRRSSELSITPIALHTTFVPEVVALIYRPWHLVDVELDGNSTRLLVDGGSAEVEGEAPILDIPPRPAPTPSGEVPTLAPSRCPECGADLAFAPEAVLHLCRNCYRLVEMRGTRWTVIPYRHEAPQPGRSMVPFWRFPLRLRGAGDELALDLPHLRDGIDGTFDQIGDVPQRPQDFLVPAFRTRVSKAGIRLYHRLWPVLQGDRPEPERERFAPAVPPGDVVDISLPAAEARAFGRVYLALAFTQRDLARAEIKRVRAAFLDATLEGEPEIIFLALASELIEPFRHLFGRAKPAAVADLEGGPRVDLSVPVPGSTENP